jgi:hypothetical protein
MNVKATSAVFWRQSCVRATYTVADNTPDQLLFLHLLCPAAGIVALFYLRSSPFLLALIPASFWVPQVLATTTTWGISRQP